MEKYVNSKFLVTTGALALLAFSLMLPELSMAADLKQGMEGIRDALSNTILPLLSVIGLMIAAFSFLTGNPNAKQHAFYALIGALIGFGAQAIIDFIKTSVSTGF